MKSPTAYYLLLLYITVMLKPLLPIVNDWWSHEFNEVEHISLVHAKYGSHHLQKEVADTSSDSENNKSQNISKSEDQFPFHISPQIHNYVFKIASSNNNYLSTNAGKLPFVVISNQGPPPKFS